MVKLVNALLARVARSVAFRAADIMNAYAFSALPHGSIFELEEVVHDMRKVSLMLLASKSGALSAGKVEDANAIAEKYQSDISGSAGQALHLAATATSAAILATKCKTYTDVAQHAKEAVLCVIDWRKYL